MLHALDDAVEPVGVLRRPKVGSVAAGILEADPEGPAGKRRLRQLRRRKSVLVQFEDLEGRGGGGLSFGRVGEDDRRVVPARPEDVVLFDHLVRERLGEAGGLLHDSGRARKK